MNLDTTGATSQTLPKKIIKLPPYSSSTYPGSGSAHNIGIMKFSNKASIPCLSGKVPSHFSEFYSFVLRKQSKALKAKPSATEQTLMQAHQGGKTSFSKFRMPPPLWFPVACHLFWHIICKLICLRYWWVGAGASSTDKCQLSGAGCSRTSPLSIRSRPNLDSKGWFC